MVDEPPGLLGDDTAPNPSEASLAALGSCLAVGIHANAVARGITVFKLEIELEGDLNITGVWGTGDLSEKPVGFTDVRAKVTFEADRPREELEALIAHARVWSPVANTFTRPVNLEVSSPEPGIGWTARCPSAAPSSTEDIADARPHDHAVDSNCGRRCGCRRGGSATVGAASSRRSCSGSIPTGFTPRA